MTIFQKKNIQEESEINFTISISMTDATLVCKITYSTDPRLDGRMSCKKGSFQQMHHNDELSKAVERSTMVESFDNVLHD